MALARPAAFALLLALAAAGAGPAAADPAGSPRRDGGKCVACHGATPPRTTLLPPFGRRERPGPPAHRLLREAFPAPPGGWDDCVGCHRGDGRTVRKELAHRGFLPAAAARFRIPGDGATERGKALLARSGCRRCHVTGGEGVSLAADLDRSSALLPPPETVAAIRSPAAAMPDFRFDEGDAAALLNALLANGRGRADRREGPSVVHFSRAGSGERERHPFAARCGPCHRALTERFGLLGTGTAGPDLSSLFTPFHPGRRRGGERWKEGDLPAWARNPRSVRPGALMPPQRLREGEAEAAAETLRVGADRIRPGGSTPPPRTSAGEAGGGGEGPGREGPSP